MITFCCADRLQRVSGVPDQSAGLVYRPGQSRTVVWPANESDRNPVSSGEPCWGAGRSKTLMLLDLSALVPVERTEGCEAEPAVQIAMGSSLRAVLMTHSRNGMRGRRRGVDTRSFCTPGRMRNGCYRPRSLLAPLAGRPQGARGLNRVRSRKSVAAAHPQIQQRRRSRSGGGGRLLLVRSDCELNDDAGYRSPTESRRHDLLWRGAGVSSGAVAHPLWLRGGLLLLPAPRLPEPVESGSVGESCPRGDGGPGPRPHR